MNAALLLSLAIVVVAIAIAAASFLAGVLVAGDAQILRLRLRHKRAQIRARIRAAIMRPIDAAERIVRALLRPWTTTAPVVPTVRTMTPKPRRVVGGPRVVKGKMTRRMEAATVADKDPEGRALAAHIIASQ